MVDPNVSYKAVHASRGKAVRAEPIAALYEQGRVHHVGQFPMLEDQMSAFTSDFDRGRAGYSPDRLDALVWAVTELAVKAYERAAIEAALTGSVLAARKAMLLYPAIGEWEPSKELLERLIVHC